MIAPVLALTRVPPTRWASLSEVLAFVARTEAHGAPRRIAISRAATKYEVPKDLIKAFLTPPNHSKRSK